MSRIQLIARLRDFIDSLHRRGWYAPPGTYHDNRPFRHQLCHVCGGKHFPEAHR